MYLNLYNTVKRSLDEQAQNWPCAKSRLIQGQASGRFFFNETRMSPRISKYI